MKDESEAAKGAGRRAFPGNGSRIAKCEGVLFCVMEEVGRMMSLRTVEKDQGVTHDIIGILGRALTPYVQRMNGEGGEGAGVP